jgi:hypothetical protein
MSEGRIGLLRVSPDLLLQALGLPFDTVILDCRALTEEFGIIELKIAHRDLKPVERYSAIPRVSANLSRHDAIPERLVFEGWRER